MSKYKRLGKNTLWVFVGNVGTKCISILMLPFYTRWLSVNDYGVTDLIGVYVLLLSSLITCCMADAIFRFPKDRSRDEVRQYFSTGALFLVVALLLAGGLFLAVGLAMRYSEGFFAQYAAAIYLIILSAAWQQYLQQFARAIDRMNIYVISGVVMMCLTAGLSFWLIPRYGLEGYIAAQVAGNLGAFVYSFSHGRMYRYFRFSFFSKAALSEMMRYALPLIPNASMWWIIGVSNRLFIERFRGMEEVGLFAVPNRFSAVLVTLFGIFFASWQIAVLEEFRSEGYKEFYNKVLRLVFAVLCAAFIGLSVLAYPLTYYLVDHRFLESWRYIPVLTLGVVLSSLSTYVGTNFTANKQTKYFLTTSLWGAAVSLLANWLLVPGYGLMGAAVAAVTAQATMLVLRWERTRKYAPVESLGRYLLSLLWMVLLIASLLCIPDMWIRVGAVACSVALLGWTNRRICL